MKKIALFFLLLSLNLISFSRDTVRVALMHPTVYNLRTFNYLIKNRFIAIPNLKLVAVTYDGEDYNYDKSKKFAQDSLPNKVEFIDLAGRLKPDELYKQNHLSDQFKKIMENTEAVIFPGGDDLPAYTYGEPTSLLNVNLNPQRHYLELSFLFHLYGGFQNPEWKDYLNEKPNYVILGICLGAQTMSTAAGGTMIQDIPSELYEKKSYDEVTEENPEEIHRSAWYNIYSEPDILSCSFHHVRFSGDFSKKIWLENYQPKILSCHHQAIEKPGKNFKIWASSLDKKVIEGIYNTVYPNVFAVQFHPEATILYKKGSFKKINPKDAEMDISTVLNDEDRIFHRALWAYFSKTVINSVK